VVADPAAQNEPINESLAEADLQAKSAERAQSTASTQATSAAEKQADELEEDEYEEDDEDEAHADDEVDNANSPQQFAENGTAVEPSPTSGAEGANLLALAAKRVPKRSLKRKPKATGTQQPAAPADAAAPKSGLAAAPSVKDSGATSEVGSKLPTGREADIESPTGLPSELASDGNAKPSQSSRGESPIQDGQEAAPLAASENADNDLPQNSEATGSAFSSSSEPHSATEPDSQAQASSAPDSAFWSSSEPDSAKTSDSQAQSSSAPESAFSSSTEPLNEGGADTEAGSDTNADTDASPDASIEASAETDMDADATQDEPSPAMPTPKVV